MENFHWKRFGLEWKAEMNDRYGGVMCALFLKVNPMGKGIVQELSTGDETIIASQNDLGTYYLDDMYTMRSDSLYAA